MDSPAEARNDLGAVIERLRVGHVTDPAEVKSNSAEQPSITSELPIFTETPSEDRAKWKWGSSPGTPEKRMSQDQSDIINRGLDQLLAGQADLQGDAKSCDASPGRLSAKIEAPPTLREIYTESFRLLAYTFLPIWAVLFVWLLDGIPHDD